MDAEVLVQALTGTLDPQGREQAEAVLQKLYQLPEFTPCLLQIVVNDSVQQATRQAGAVYLKNYIHKYWKARDPSEEEPVPYIIPDTPKALIRDNIVEAIIQTPHLISWQLCVCLEHIVKLDFPTKWTGVMGKCHGFLSSPNQQTWLGSLHSLYQVSKKYRYKKAEEKVVYVTAMKQLLPLLHERFSGLLTDQSAESAAIQHWIMKVFYASMQFQLPLELINENTLPNWMMVFRTIVERPVPPEALKEEEEERHQLEWWKCKKWALHIIGRIFERYGSPGNVDKAYNLFAAYYMKTFSSNVVNTLLRQLEGLRQGQYLTGRVKQLVFNYLTEVLPHSAPWKQIRPHFQGIFTDIIFPLMSYSDEDDQLWNEDPYEYIRMKFDIFEDLVSPVVAAQLFFTTACDKRKNTLDPIMAFCIEILNQPKQDANARRRDGALHVIGSVSDILMKKKQYKDHLEAMLVTHVFPEFMSSLGYMRARACWMLHYFAEIKYSSEQNLHFGLSQVFSCLTQDKELPVKVEAAVAIQYLIKNQHVAEKIIEPHVKDIICELLVVIRETENDDLTSVLQELIETYSENITDVTVELCTTLNTTFSELIDPNGAEDDGYKALTALGLLSAIQSLVRSVVQQPPLMRQMEAILANTIAAVLQNGIMDYYEEMLMLMDLFTMEVVSPVMWQMLGIIYTAFQRDAFDFFNEMMTVMYNYIRVDTTNFLSNTSYVEVVIEMAKAILTGDPGEDPQINACKLLEVLVLQCKGGIDQYIPTIIGLALQRLTLPITAPELRFGCVMVVVAAIYNSCGVVMELLEKTRFPSSPDSITDQFFTQWLKDCSSYQGVHDRKMSVLGLCSVLNSPVKPAAVQSKAALIVPTIMDQLTQLLEAYKTIAEEGEEEEGEDNDEEEEEDDADAELEDEEDESSKNSTMGKAVTKLNAMDEEELDDDDDDDDDDAMTQTMLEIDYDTVIDDEDVVDEFCVFHYTINSLQAQNREWFSILTSGFTPELTLKLQQLLQNAEQRESARTSRKIEEQGGYNFTITSVPNAFNFKTP